MNTIQEIQADIVEEFAVLTDWMDKYEYLIELGKSMPLIEEKDKTEENLIRGCQSRVWLSCRAEDGRLHMTDRRPPTSWQPTNRSSRKSG